MLEDDAGDALAAWLLARATMGDDRAASRAAVDRAVTLSASGAPALALRAQQLLHDPEVPDRIGRARALADLGEAAGKDPSLIRIRLTAAALERDSERYDDAAQDLDRAEGALHDEKLPPSARLLVGRARLLDARGNSAGARARAEEALRLVPGRCDTLQLLLDLSRRGGSLAEQNKYVDALTGCSDGIPAAAQAARTRGDLARAEQLLRLAATRTCSPRASSSLRRSRPCGRPRLLPRGAPSRCAVWRHRSRSPARRRRRGMRGGQRCGFLPVTSSSGSNWLSTTAQGCSPGATATERRW
jgi:tetratricopeptide (TPR) repeat protein